MSSSWPIFLSGGRGAISPAGVALTGSEANRFTGPGRGRGIILNQVEIPDGAAWEVSSQTGAVLQPNFLTIAGTFRLAAGTIVKVDNGLDVLEGGRLEVAGDATDPVVFTSSPDDTVGGDTNGDGDQSTPKQGDYGTAIRVPADGHLDVSFAELRYGSTAIQTQADTVNLAAVTIQHFHYGLVVTEGSVAFRGAVADVSQAITACIWHSGVCLVDAAYVDWGTPAGPWDDAGNAIVCGAVTVNPWVGAASDSPTFAVPNCDGSRTPEEQLTSAATTFHQTYSRYRIDCSNGYKDACEALRQAYGCLTAAVGLANSQSGLPVPLEIPDSADPDFDGAGRFALARFVETAGDYVADVEELHVTAPAHIPPSGFGRVASVVGRVFRVVSVFFALSDAYNRCS